MCVNIVMLFGLLPPNSLTRCRKIRHNSVMYILNIISAYILLFEWGFNISRFIGSYLVDRNILSATGLHNWQGCTKKRSNYLAT